MRQISTLFTCLILLFSTIYAQVSSSLKTPGFKILNRSMPLTASGCENVIRMRCLTTSTNNKPLFVIDGVVAEEFELKNINPNDIESITILKDHMATALYCRASSGVVLITTKNANQRTIKIRDEVSGEPLPFATIDLIYGQRKQHSIRLHADSLGQVSINKIKPEIKYELRVSNIGYETFTAFMNASLKTYIVSLQRNYSDLKEVFVISGRTISCRNLTYCSSKVICDCLDEIKTVRNTSIHKLNAQSVQRELKFYPNPVLRSQQVNIEFENAKQEKITLKLYSLDGRVVGTKEDEAIKGMNKISYSISAQLAAGTYFIQLIDENNKGIKTEKLIIQ